MGPPCISTSASFALFSTECIASLVTLVALTLDTIVQMVNIRNYVREMLNLDEPNYGH